jgi:flavin reductase
LSGDLKADENPSLRAEFIDAMRRAATGVSVVTTDGQAGRFGVTVSAVASVSADPPMLLVCINRRSPCWAAIQANGVFTVNLLSEMQTHVADSFAGRAAAPFDFNCADWADDDTALPPRLQGAVAAFHCKIAQAHDAGSHAVVIGHVVNAFSSAAAPLAYVAQNYASTALLHANAA